MLQNERRPYLNVQELGARQGLSQQVLDWILLFLAFAGLTILTTLGNAGAFLFLLASALLAVTRLQLLLEVLYGNAWVFVLPSLFFLSALWSDYPTSTLRSAGQFFSTVAAAVVIGSCIRPRVLTSACFSALLLTAVTCMMLGLGGYLQGDEQALHLILGSKNQLAQIGAFLLLTSLTLILDGFQPSILRSLAGICVFIALFVLYTANSAGTSLFVIPAVFTMCALTLSWILPGQARLAVGVIGLLTALTAGLAVITYIGDPTAILELLGKDSTLTGRADLWNYAQSYFSERPLLGLGYQAFWQIENPRAQLLWFLNDQPVGSGFNFHNLYLNTAVELGLAGIAALGTLMLSMMGRLFLTLLGPITPKQTMAAGFFVYLLGLSVFEVIQTYQFTLGTVLFYIAWCYLRPRRK